MVLFSFDIYRKKPVYRVGENVTIIFIILNDEDEQIWISGINNPLPIGVSSGIKMITADGNFIRDLLIPSFTSIDPNVCKHIGITFKFLKEGTFNFSPQLLLKNRNPIMGGSFTFNVSDIPPELGIKRVGTSAILQTEEWMESNRNLLLTVKINEKTLKKVNNIIVNIVLEETTPETLSGKVEKGIYGTVQDVSSLIDMLESSIGNLELETKVFDALSRVILNCVFSRDVRSCILETLGDLLLTNVENTNLQQELRSKIDVLASRLKEILDKETLFHGTIDKIQYLAFKEEDLIMLLGYSEETENIEKIVLLAFLEKHSEIYEHLNNISNKFGMKLIEINNYYVLSKTYKEKPKSSKDIERTLTSFDKELTNILIELFKATRVRLAIKQITQLDIEQIKQILGAG